MKIRLIGYSWTIEILEKEDPCGKHKRARDRIQTWTYKKGENKQHSKLGGHGDIVDSHTQNFHPKISEDVL